MKHELRFVVDASIAVKLFLSEVDSVCAVELFADEAAILYVPDLFFVESANVLWKKVRRGEYVREDAMQNLADLAALGLNVTSTIELVESAFEIAAVYGATVYDACYVALAERLGVPLVTADVKLAAKLSQTEYQVLVLQNMENHG